MYSLSGGRWLARKRATSDPTVALLIATWEISTPTYSEKRGATSTAVIPVPQPRSRIEAPGT
jgi:hypothetical protein